LTLVRIASLSSVRYHIVVLLRVGVLLRVMVRHPGVRD